jgi:hypothetical protein
LSIESQKQNQIFTVYSRGRSHRYAVVVVFVIVSGLDVVGRMKVGTEAFNTRLSTTK